MNTATVLIENVIQGIQTALWIILLLFSFVDYSLLIPHMTINNLTVVSILLLALCYWLGIMVDTVYYHLFIQSFERKWALRRLQSLDLSLSTMVFRCFIASQELGKLLMERQAHLRMLRVSMINIVFIVLSGLLFLHLKTNHVTFQSHIIIIVAGSALFLSTAYAWRKLYEYYITIAKNGYEAVLAHQSASQLT
jgi:hypothetical protein